ncbi:Surface antigen variable number repeat-containing protein [Lutibacter sp. Hel_I_33_5]|uniref:translocation and assembly module lipoprotein TamL n=1 Tax=Lutibacter sp. Hel_I_33_5 TaxID=1566289 RepID=UPI00119EA38B|nr:BamA/TamA family outer membrane protein [Lutibacter sp. Hel_I_33_5]TVZ56731.1 Surface antigen variable number repeat-containing protein [Lutibacter sp. Hel_I_33_5]
MKKLSFYFLLLIILASCNSTKHVAEDEHMLTQNYVYVDSVRNKSEELQKLLLQKPNARLLDLPLGLYFHNFGNHDKPTTPKEWAKKNPHSYNLVKNLFSEKQSIAYAKTFIGLNNWFLNYPGPEIINKRKVGSTKNNLTAYYKNHGYFHSKVDTVVNEYNDKKATVEYHITPGKPTLLDTINVDIESPVLDSIYKESKITSLLRKGDQYKDNVFREEANKLVKLFRNNGIYHFNKSAIGFYIGSDSTEYKTNVDLIVSGERYYEESGKTLAKPYQQQKISKINIYTDYYFTKKSDEYLDTLTYKNIRFLAHDKIRYNPKYLSESIFLKINKNYSDSLSSLTRNHLKSLKNFKSTIIKFQDLNDHEIQADIFLTPIEKYTLGFETELTHSNIRDVGISAKFSIIDRNVFRGAEILKLSLLGSYFTSKNGPGWEIGADVSLNVPRFFAPFGLQKSVPKRMSPNTLISLGTSIQKNIGLDRQTFAFGLDYKWQFSPKKTIQLEIFNTQYIKNLNTQNYFKIYSSEKTNLNSIAKTHKNDADFSFPTIKNATDLEEFTEIRDFMNEVSIDNSFKATNATEFQNNLNILNRFNILTSDFLIPTIAYSFTFNSKDNFTDNNFSFFKIRIANSGNVMGIINEKLNLNNKSTVFNIPVAQYFKTDFEYKQFWDVGNNAVFGFRSFLGAIFTYENSDIPFTKSYFAGGANDIRAWHTYELGPGKTNTGLEFNIGSLKFLTSLEYRFDIVGKLKGALFLDAGNIWDITGSSFVDEAAKFNGFGSLGDMAVGGGFGTRIDFSFLIIRLDLGFKMHEPYLTGNRWFKNFNISNSVFNIGINYPF